MIPSRLALVAVLACGASLAASAVSCAAFSASSDPTDAGSDDALASADGAGGGDPGCFPLTQGRFTPTSGPNGTVSAAGVGLLVSYPVGLVPAGTRTAPVPLPAGGGTLDGGVADMDSGGGGAVDGGFSDGGVGGGDGGGGGGAGAGSVAMWTATFPVNGMRAATVTIEAAIDLQTALPLTPWFASFGGLVNGSLTSSTASLVQLALASAGNGSQMDFDVNTFPGGTAASGTGPSTSNNFGGLALPVASPTPHGVKVVLDVVWSETGAQTTVSAGLDKQTPVQVSTATLTGPLATSWTVVLGGTAVGNPALNIRYGRACVSLRP